jgi:tryptophan synthase alpha chain
VCAVNRLETTLRANREAGRKLLVPYVTGGITAGWTDHLLAYQEAGADAIEVGLPFSDPMLDGATIQQASDRALARRVTPDRILSDLAAVRDRVRVPLVAMTYANLVARLGYPEFCRRLADAGVSGLIVPDLPLDELGGLDDDAAAAGIDLVLLVAPSTTPERLDDICARSRGFVYAVSAMGTTGERADLAVTATALASSVTARTDRPVLIGFGVSTPAHAVVAATTADGVVVASALMRRVLDGATVQEVAVDVAALRAGLDTVATSPRTGATAG